MAQKPWVVIDAEILSSSVWSESAHVRLVWITLLILCDTEGYVGASVPGVAHHAGVTLEQAEDAIKRLKAPDPHSRTKTNDGRRLEDADRGWKILNFIDQISRLSAERAKSRDRTRRWRDRHKAVTVTDVTSGNVTRDVGNRDKGIGNRENVGTEVPPTPPPEERAENATKETIQSHQLRLGTLLCQLSEHENSRLMVPAWCRKVTSYEKADGKAVRGFADYRRLESIDRLEKSIGDAEFWLGEMGKRRLVDA